MKFAYGWINPVSAVTADLSSYNDVKAFYDSLDKSNTTIQTDAGAKTTIWGTFFGPIMYVWVLSHFPCYWVCFGGYGPSYLTGCKN
jgi:hypothetical protein